MLLIVSFLNWLHLCVNINVRVCFIYIRSFFFFFQWKSTLPYEVQNFSKAEKYRLINEIEIMTVGYDWDQEIKRQHLTKTLLFQLSQLWFKIWLWTKKCLCSGIQPVFFCLFFYVDLQILLPYKQDSSIPWVPVLLLPYWIIHCLLSNHNMNQKLKSLMFKFQAKALFLKKYKIVYINWTNWIWK